jgi:hypothetical protein
MSKAPAHDFRRGQLVDFYAMAGVPAVEGKIMQVHPIRLEAVITELESGIMHGGVPYGKQDAGSYFLRPGEQ